MNQLININQTQTMSSREISELTCKQHKDVLYDIRKMLTELELSTADFSAVYKAENGQEYEYFNLDKENTLILVSGYNVKIRQAIIKRWQELENNQPKVPTNFIEAMTLALDQAKQLEQQSILLEQQKPQVEFANDVANTCDSISIGGYAGLLASSGYDIGQNRLFAWLREKGYLTTRKNRPSIQAIEAGWFKWVESTYICPRTGIPKVSGHPTISGKGQIYLRKKLIKELGVKA